MRLAATCIKQSVIATPWGWPLNTDLTVYIRQALCTGQWYHKITRKWLATLAYNFLKLEIFQYSELKGQRGEGERGRKSQGEGVSKGWHLIDIINLSAIVQLLLKFSSSMKLLGITIDNALNFREHVSGLIRKVSNQLQVLKRHKRLIPTGAKKHLYEAFILSHLNYCSVIWLHCGKKNVDKLEKINERCLRFVFNDLHSTYDELLDYINQPCLQDCRRHDMLSDSYLSST